MKTFNFYVIGGQYENHYYGGSNTLRGAKMLATRNTEHWDNWQGFHKPGVYKAEDCEIIKTKGYICYPDGTEIAVPLYHAERLN